MADIDESLTRQELVALGARLHTLRAERGWTLDDVARRVSLSKSYLSRLEDGERQPSIAALLSLAQAYGLPLAALFGPPESKSQCAVVRAEAGIRRQGNGLVYTSLSQTTRATNMQPLRVLVPANRAGDEMYQHDGEEWLYVLSGRLCLSVGGETIQLNPGDAAHFDARAPHRLAAEGKADAELILVACAAPRSLLDSYL